MLAAQCRMARAATGLGVRDLAKLADVSPDTIARLERGEELKPATVTAIRTALEAAGIEFIGENGGGPGARLAWRTMDTAPLNGEEVFLRWHKEPPFPKTDQVSKARFKDGAWKLTRGKPLSDEPPTHWKRIAPSD